MPRAATGCFGCLMKAAMFKTLRCAALVLNSALWKLPELGEDNPLYHGDSQRPENKRRIMKEFNGEVAVITGAGHGISRGIALRCAKESMKGSEK